MTNARELGDVYAVALGAGAKAAAATLGKHGAKAVHVNEDPAFDDYIAEPATDALAALYEKERPDLILFAFTSDSREVAGRLAARLGAGLRTSHSSRTSPARSVALSGRAAPLSTRAGCPTRCRLDRPASRCGRASTSRLASRARCSTPSA